MSKNKVEIFKSDKVSEGGCGCGCGCGCGDGTTAYIDMELLKDRFIEKYPNLADITITNIDELATDEVIAKLNDIFAANEIEVRVDKINLDFVNSKVLPLILVDGKIIAANDYPEEDQLYNAVISGEPIPKRGGCC